MQQQIDNLQKQINDLQTQLANSLSNNSMSMELRETIRNEVVKDAVTGTATEEYTLTGDPEVITITKKPTNFIILKWRGKEYNVPYYETI
jgi:regulator of replication initiation timing